jgi:CubicO group peptidase (beta-lactamase class C family)
MMKTVSLTFLLTLILLQAFPQSKVELVDSLFTTLHNTERFSGDALIVWNGKPIYQRSFGIADRDQQTAIDKNTIFNTGAVSMAITAVAILQLHEKGMLDVDATVSTYLSGFPYENITLGHLLTHGSGLPEIQDLLPDWDRGKLITNNDVMQALYDQKPPLAFDPNFGSRFNNVGYIVLAEIIKIITRQEFAVYLQHNIFTKASMGSTGIFSADQVTGKKNTARGYFYSPFTQKTEEAIKSTDVGKLYALSGTMGNSNVWSTSEDLLKFCEAISSSLLINQETVSSMFLKKTDALMPGQDKSYGNSFSYGWIIPNTPQRIAWARGSMPGYNSEIMWNLSEKRILVFQSNDYLSFTSYNNLLPYTISTVFNMDTLMIPRRYASIELTNEVLHISDAEIKSKLEKLKADTDNYIFDVAGLDYLVARLRDLGETAKADLISQLLTDMR